MTDPQSSTPRCRQFPLTLGTLLIGLVLLNISVFFSTVNPSPRQLQYLLFRFDPRHWPAPSPFSVTLWLLCLWLAIDTVMLFLKRYVSQTFYAQKIAPIRQRFSYLALFFIPAYLFGWFALIYRFGWYSIYWPYVYGPLTEWMLSGKIPWHLSVLPILAFFMIVWLLRIAQKSRSHH